MASGENVGDGVTKTTYIPTDGTHAFYAGSQAYTGADGVEMLGTVTTEMLHWVTHDDGRTTLDACYDGTWFRRSKDNGVTWKDEGTKVRFETEVTVEQMMPAGLSLDTRNDVLIRFHRGQKADKTCYGYINQGAYRAFYSVSTDRGVTWSDPVQIVDSREGFDGVKWGPEFEYGVFGGILNGDHCVWMDDGALLAPFTIYERLDGTKPWYFRILCARGAWNADRTALEWEFGHPFEVGLGKATSGTCEPSITSLGGNRLYMTTRCQGGEPQGLYSTRYSTLSEDGGMTWSDPEPLLYDDGSPVHTPASVSAFYDSTGTGKTYWIGNILGGPVHGQTPRYPLKLAEFDPDKTCLVRDSVRLVQDRPEGAHELVRYTNFGNYEDRESGHLIITLPEQYRNMGYDMEKPEDFAADCVKYTVEL
ncbi:MAG: sialidase family protein [Candidatus Latescibacteria bacterium]|jgi:hypothetical protein|nr:sialidase family protein [Candidatus Latescibacterota bacterium]